MYDMASLTKVVSATTAAMILEEEGKLDLERTVASYLPEYDVPDKRKITVRMLLTHTSGIRSNHPLWKEAKGREQYLAGMIEFPLDARSRARRRVYTDWNMVLLQFIVERLTGQTLDQFVEARVFGPLGMRDTRYNPPESIKPRIAPTENEDFRGGQVWGVVHDETAWVLGGVSGNAGLFSSARDLAVFVPDAAQRRLVRRRADPQAGDGRAMDGAPASGREPRVRLGYPVAELERGPLLLAAQLRPHGVYGHVDLGGPGARVAGGAADESREPDARQPEDRPPAPRGRGHRAAIDHRRAAASSGKSYAAAMRQLSAISYQLHISSHRVSTTFGRHTRPFEARDEVRSCPRTRVRLSRDQPHCDTSAATRAAHHALELCSKRRS